LGSTNTPKSLLLFFEKMSERFFILEKCHILNTFYWFKLIFLLMLHTGFKQKPC